MWGGAFGSLVKSYHCELQIYQQFIILLGILFIIYLMYALAAC